MSSMQIPTLYECKSKIRVSKGVRPSIIETRQCTFQSYDRDEAQEHADEYRHEVWGSPSGERLDYVG